MKKEVITPVTFQTINTEDSKHSLIQVVGSKTLMPAVSHTYQISSMNYDCFIFVESGRWNFKSDTEIHEVEENSIILLKKNHEVFISTVKNPCCLHIMLLCGDVLNLYFSELLLMNKKDSPGYKIISLKNSAVLQKHVTSLLQATIEDNLSSLIYTHKIFTDILTDLSFHLISEQDLKKPPKYLQAMHDLLQKDYSHNYSLYELETIFHKNKYKICREFTSCYQMSPMKFLNQVRLEEAKSLLEETDLPIHQIGISVGIENTNHFIKQFKNFSGATPLVYRKQFRNSYHPS